MSDFTSNFWSLYVTILTLASLVCCAVLLWVTSRQRNVVSSDATTGHVWDVDLEEGNHPLPRWWVWLFVITLVFAFAYLAFYPGLGSAKGALGWSSVGQYDAEMARGARETAPLYARFAAMPVETVARDPQAMAIGDRLFMNNCAQCHGSDAHGSKGFPSLADNDWLHGGSPEAITETITNGRIGVMPVMASAVGGEDDVQNVANYVLSLSGSPHDARRAELGKPKFAVCAACHGADGRGNQAIGAPNLTDNIWLHGFGEKAIMAMVENGKTNQMPAQSSQFTPEQIHVLTAYVWGLSHPAGAAR
jgi:cytochrome c oxidase cbb3-type subunit 3